MLCIGNRKSIVFVGNSDIQEFDMRCIGDSKIIAFVGKAKHIIHAVKDFLYYSSDIPATVVISSSKISKNMFEKHIPFIYHKYTPDVITRFISRQKYICRKILYDANYMDINPRALLIIDDGISWINDKNMKWLLNNHRSVCTTILLIMPSNVGLSPNLRSNIDFIFIGKETRPRIILDLFRRYAGIICSEQIFESALTYSTYRYRCVGGCLVINNKSRSTEVLDKIFKYKPVMWKWG